MNNQRGKGPQQIGDLLGGSLGASLEKLKAGIDAKQQKRIEAAARPGESKEQVAARLRDEDARADRERNASSPVKSPPPSPSIRKPPTGDEQPDFFVPSLYDVGTKDSRSIMDVAVFRLSKKDKRAGGVIRYELSDGYVEVKAGPDGMASVWDYDLVLMMVSHLTEAMNRYREGRGEKPGRTYRPHVSDILKFCRRGDGGRQADEVEGALDRLKGTTIKNVRERPSANGRRPMREVEAEGLVSSYKVLSYTENGKIASVEIEAPKWLYREVTEGKRPDVLTVHPDYFLIDPGIGRFVYRLARRAAGKGEAKWAFQTIYERSGSAGTFKEFRRILRNIIEANDLPEYELREEAGQGGPLLVMIYRDRADEALPPPSGV
ncbi:MAG: replication initiator protein A [Burkholderiales bacterium]|jgi:plasmid replication initiation protein|uniref:Plasmid replication initiation protein n=2 Tax=Pseudomonadota TaxID=1224 RepID=A0A7W6NNB0_9HYPH|nr:MULTISPECIES: replication initiator protein A [Pseudomonadota]MCZ2421056.1 replication initiator protein A [Burkholderiales bacterium]TXG98297.1 MAG: replication protein RepA [Nevskiaceae bacterium]HBO8276852.1 replication initiator protein A [Pseudomonas aeruginosa]MBB4067285.1 plasmid replication initiation protein [Gellertiella hungarica]HAT8574642.1 replication protein RepA [Legionella pneumophila]